MLRTGSVIILLLSCFACTESKVAEKPFDNTLAQFTIDSKLNYNQVLTAALELDEKTSAKSRSILASYRKNLKAKPEREKILRKNREKKLARIFNSAQLKKRKYVNTIYYNTSPKYPTHPANIKKVYQLTDGQVLKLIELEDIFAQDKDKAQREQRIAALIGPSNATKYLAGKAIVI